MIIPLKHSTLHIRWWVAILAVSLLALSIRLGFWQLDRAEQKQALQQRWAEKSSQAYHRLDSLIAQAAFTDNDPLDRDNPNSLHLHPVNWSGTPDNHRTLLLDNRMRGQKAGFEVLTPVATDSGWILVNRGWVEKTMRHYEIPHFEAFAADEGNGHVYIPPKPLTLGNAAPTDDWPKIVQSVDFDELQQYFDHSLQPFTIRAASSQTLDTQWPSLNLNPDKNLGYAVQWFLIGIALIIAFLLSGRVRHTNGPQHQPTSSESS